MSGAEEELAELRTLLPTYGLPLDEWLAIDAHLVRIAAKLPQRALSARGRPLWLHEVCGTVQDETDSSCGCCEVRCEWQPLYVLGEVTS